MGAAEVISFEEVRARKQWDTLRQQLHKRFDQWLEAHVGFQGRGCEDGVNSSHPLSQPMAGVRACRSISKI
jgi:hypothetical protein